MISKGRGDSRESCIAFFGRDHDFESGIVYIGVLFPSCTRLDDALGISIAGEVLYYTHSLPIEYSTHEYKQRASSHHRPQSTLHLYWYMAQAVTHTVRPSHALTCDRQLCRYRPLYFEYARTTSLHLPLNLKPHYDHFQDRILIAMSSNVGLSTPRGSGTSGYVQRNLSNLKPRDNAKPYPTEVEDLKHRQRQPDKDIIEHERKREIEVKVFELRDRLEEEGYVATQAERDLYTDQNTHSVDEDAIDDQCDELRKKLEAEQKRSGGGPNTKGLKSHQVHELAKAKIEESEKLRRALGIRKDYEEGSHWKRQEEKDKERAERPPRDERPPRKERERSRSRSPRRSRSLTRSDSRSRSWSRGRSRD